MLIIRIKNLLGILDHEWDTKLAALIEMAESRLKNLIGLSSSDEVPEELMYIIVEVVIARFNRIGSEGTSSHTVEGEQMVFNADDFAPYDADIKKYITKTKEEEGVGVVRFI